MKTLFLGGSYVSASLPLAAQTLINLLFEPSAPGSAEEGMFYGTPCIKTFGILGVGKVRGARTAKGYSWWVRDDFLYRVDASGAATFIGLVPGTGRCTLVETESHLFVMHSMGWTAYNFISGSYSTVAGAPTTAQGAYLRGRVYYPNADGTYGWTDIINETTLDALNFASAEANPDPIISFLADHSEALFFGEITLEIGQVTDNNDLPIAITTTVEHGCAAKFSPAKADNTVFWIGRDDNGRGVVFRLSGGSPERISTHALENEFARYADISTAWGYCYQQNGHTFYVLTFDEATWKYDLATGRWTQWAYRDPNSGELQRHRGNAYCFHNGKHLVGDHTNGNIYLLDLNTYADDGAIRYWERAWSVIEAEGNWIRHEKVQLMAEMGVGLNTGQGSDPVVLLSWSDDGCRTWSNDRELRLGAIGRYRNRAITRRLGISRNRVYRIRGTDPVKVALYGVNLDAQPASR